MRKKAIIGLAVAGALATGRCAHGAAYTWNTGTGSWQNAANWSPNSGFPSAATDTAEFDDVTADHSAVYAGTGTFQLGTLTLTQTSTFANTVDLQLSGTSSLTLSNALTLGAASGGTTSFYINPISTNGIRPVTLAAPSITLNSGGVLELSSYDKSGVGETSTVTTTSGLTISGGTLYSDRAYTSAPTNTDANTINGPVTMTGGAISIGLRAPTGNALTLGGASQSTADRLVINGNFIATGGTISVLGSGDVLFLNGLNNSIQVTSGGIAANINLGAPATSGVTQTLYSDNNLTGGVQFRQTGSTAGFAANVKFGAVTTGNTLSTGQITFQNKAVNGTQTVQLVSNVTTNAIPNQSGNLAGVTDTLDTNGYTLDATSANSVYNLSAATGGVWNLINTNLASTGVIKASGFDLSGPAGGSSVGSNLNLVATGAGGLTNNLGNTHGGTIAASSQFTYAGSGTAATPDKLSSARTIGNLVVAPVTTGVLQLASDITTGSSSKVTVAPGGTLDLSTFALRATDLTVTGTGNIKGSTGSSITTTGTLSGTGTIGAAGAITSSGMFAPGSLGTVGTISLASGSGALTFGSTGTAAFDVFGAGSFDTVAANAVTANFDGTLDVNFGSYTPLANDSFTLFAGIGAQSAGTFAVTNSQGYDLQFAITQNGGVFNGVLTVVPEPASLATMGLGAACLASRRRRRSMK